MSKGDETRNRIVEQTGGLFNQFGYGATSMSAVMQATGMQKGGLYNHFQSKEELAIEAFRFNVSRLSLFFGAATAATDDPVEQLRRIFSASLAVAAGKVVPGGCPVLNAAVESDDAFPPLREEAVGGAGRLRGLIRSRLKRAQRLGRILNGEDAESLSFFFLASLEGGIMLAKLHGVSEPLEAVLRMLNKVLDGLLVGST